MSISLLNIFAKNTDAGPALRGYQFQILKTLETWLRNKVDKKVESIYCDFEEDVFQHDEILGAARFRQLKLYSSNFSFSSAEVKKAISHFFMLYVKGEYSWDEIEFVFETNAYIKQEWRGNYADLLKEWFENQDNPDENLLVRVALVIQEILNQYIDDRAKQPDTYEKPDIQQAVLYYKSLNQSDFIAFVKKIKWKFDDIDPDRALDDVIKEIKNLIEELPYPTAKENITIIIARLHMEIWERAGKVEIKDKALNNELLDNIVLQIGNSEDKVYQRIYQKWFENPEVKVLIYGEFYEVISASEFCRYRSFLTGHDELWHKVISQYVNLIDIPQKIRRKGIYELCTLALRGDPDTMTAIGTLSGLEKYILRYYEKFNFRVDELQDTLILLMMVVTSVNIDASIIAPKLSKTWLRSFKDRIDELKRDTTNPSDLCEILDILGQFAYMSDTRNIEPAQKYFLEVIGLLENAPDFSVTKFYDCLIQYMKLAVKFKFEDWEENAEIFEKLAEQVEPFVIKRNGNFTVAKRLIITGSAFLEEGEIKYYLKALDAFHKTKDLYRVNEYMEGYILSLINIAKLYADSGMLFAAKYYALCAIWRLHSANRPDLNKRFADAMLLLVTVDFKQGAWVTVFEDLHLFLTVHAEFNLTEKSIFNQARFALVMHTISVVVAVAPFLQPKLRSYIDGQINSLKWIYKYHMEDNVRHLSSGLKKPAILNQIIESSVIDKPLNDCGTKRTVSWDALGIQWFVNFENSFETNAAGEEFCALLQIVQVEMAIKNYDFNLMPAAVHINVVISSQQSMPVQTPSNTISAWKIYIHELKSNVIRDVQDVYNRMLSNIGLIFQDISFLKALEFSELFHKFLLERKVPENSLLENGYQRIYKEVYDYRTFASSLRNQVYLPETSLDFPKSNIVLTARIGLSDKYKKERSEENIRNRYEISQKHYYLTLEYYRNDTSFHLLIRRLRDEGWLDWQISVGLMNLVLGYKARNLVESRGYKTDQRKREAFEELFYKALKGKESDNYKPIPIQVFLDEMDHELELFAVRFLESLGLQFKAKFPNFSAVKKFSSERLNFGSDDIPELSPLKFITPKLALSEAVKLATLFDIAVSDNDSPAVYHLVFPRHLEGWDFINDLRGKIAGFVDMRISIKDLNIADLQLLFESGSISLINLPVKADFKKRAEGYYSGELKTCILAASSDKSNIHPVYIITDELISVKNVQFL